MVVFFFGGASMTSMILSKLQEGQKPKVWGDGYALAFWARKELRSGNSEEAIKLLANAREKTSKNNHPAVSALIDKVEKESRQVLPDISPVVQSIVS
jgi:hypothetical protein